MDITVKFWKDVLARAQLSTKMAVF